MGLHHKRVDHFLVYRCSIVRGTVTEEPEMEGYAGEPVWDIHLQDVPCIFWNDIRRTSGQYELPERVAIREYITFAFPSSTDILENDLIEGVVDRRGQSLNANQLHVISVMREHSNLRVMAQERH